MTSDEDLYSCDDSQDHLDTFLSNHLDGIIDLFYDLQDRFHYMFGSLRSTHLTDLILVCCGIVSLEDSGLSIVTLNSNNTTKFSRFTIEYDEELRTSHWLVCMCMTDMKMKNIVQMDMWCKFCFSYCSHSV